MQAGDVLAERYRLDDLLAEAGDGSTNAFRVAAFREGWAWTPRSWPNRKAIWHCISLR